MKYLCRLRLRHQRLCTIITGPLVLATKAQAGTVEREIQYWFRPPYSTGKTTWPRTPKAQSMGSHSAEVTNSPSTMPMKKGRHWR